VLPLQQKQIFLRLPHMEPKKNQQNHRLNTFMPTAQCQH
jgi:hypothetical protein